MQVETQYLYRKQTETSHRCRLLSQFIPDAEQEWPADVAEVCFAKGLEGKKIPSTPHTFHQREPCLTDRQPGTNQKDAYKRCGRKMTHSTSIDRRAPASQQQRWYPTQQPWREIKVRLIWLPLSSFLVLPSVISLDAGPPTKSSLR